MLTIDNHVFLGFRMLTLCNLITGFWLHTPSSWPRRFLVLIYEFFTICIVITSIFIHSLQISSNEDFFVLIISMTATLKLTTIFVFAVTLLVQKRSVLKIICETQNLINTYKFRFHQNTVLQRTSKIITIYFLVPFLFLIVNNFHAMFSMKMIEMLGTNESNVTSNEKKFFDALIHRDENDQNRDVNNMILFLFAFSQTFSLAKSITMSATFLGLLYFVGEELRVLRLTLHEAMLTGHVTSYKRIQLVDWLRYQYRLARLMGQINSVWSYAVAVMFACDTVSICFLCYAVVRVAQYISVIRVLISYWLLAILPIFLYCQAGHRLRTQADALVEATCRCPWLRVTPSLVPGLHLVALDCSRSFVARGGPFFTLSLEFFASVVGAVLTYLVVLLQIK
ncbi:Odorant receptor 26 [Ephemera danica]|nr:Odorant receptor 26 [Ephemera danica]